MALETFNSFLLFVVILVVGLWALRNSSAAGGDTSNGGGDVFAQLAQAIYDFEDPFKTATATRNNNPGNMRPPNGSATYWPGQTGVDSRGFAVFDSLSSGMAALIGDLKYKATHHPDWSIQDLFNVWLGGAPGVPPNPSQGNAVTYAQFVAQKIGVAISTTLGQLAVMG